MWAGRLEFVTFITLIIQIVVSIPPKRFMEWVASKRRWDS
jgi:hypothetical protein